MASETVNVRVNRLTKAALDFFAAAHYAQTGVSLTNDAAIMRALELAAPESVEAARKAGAGPDGNVENGDDDSDVS